MNINKMNLSVLVMCVCASTALSETVTVNSKLGTINGIKTETKFLDKTGKVSKFLGIPFAEPPIGERRFRKPIPKAHLSDPFDAMDFGAACPQDLFMMMGWVPGFPYIDEDCLTLNVFVPGSHSRNSTGSYAVMVWIYGGAYVIGQSKIYSAENLTMVGDVIVVTVNYRVSALGFLSTGSNKYPGNAGLWDQQLALRWVHDNIADFGGDPNRVTIFGESAGGSSVLFHSLYPGNQGLFQRLISESGSPLCPWAYQSEPQKFARKLADNLGCKDMNLDTAVDCLQKLDFWTISNNSRVGTHNETVFRAEWAPSRDWDFITRAQPDLFTTDVNNFRDLDYMVGMNTNDGAFVTLLSVQSDMEAQLNKSFDTGIPRDFFEKFYVPLYMKAKYGGSNKILEDFVTHVYTDWRDVNNDLYMRQRFLEFAGDYNFFMPLLEGLKIHAQKPTKGKAFLYEFDLRPYFNNAPSWVKGASHGDELPFVFGFPWTMAEGMRFLENVPDNEMQISKNIMIMWSNFAKSGDPNTPVTIPQSITWPQYDMVTKRFLHIGAHLTSVSHNLFGARTEFWLDLLPQLQKFTSN